MGIAAQAQADRPWLARFGVFDFNLSNGELRKHGKPVPLAPQPTRVLALLLSHPGELITREEIRRNVWGDDTVVDFEQGLNHCIRQIRVELNDHADRPVYVQTVPRRGYRFVAPIVTESTAAPTLVALPSMSSGSDTSRKHRAAWYAILAAALYFVLLLSLGRAWHLFSNDSSNASSVARSANTAETRDFAEIADPNARLAYLKGRFYWNRRSPESLRKAAEYFQLAAEKDPKAAVAYAGLADAYDLMGYLGEMSPDDAYPKATAAALRALELDGSLAEAHVSLADIHAVHDWRFPEAEQEYHRAIELKPNYPTAHQWYSAFLSAMGRHEDALREARQALELDPLSLIINVSMGRAYYFAAQYDNAIERLSTAVDMDPTFVLAHVNLALAYQQKQLQPEAIAELEHAAKMSSSSPHVLATLATAYAAAGDRARALRIAVQLQRTKRSYVSSYDMALIYAGMNDRDRAFDWLQRAYDNREGDLIFLKVDPRLAKVRQDARFNTLVERVGLPP